MILQLKDNCQTIMNQYQNEKSESMDYYTTWVHQIKTPISVMQMILQSEDSDEHRELLVELFRIEQYVEMVLSYLRLDSTSSDFIFKQYKLDDIIRTAIRKFAPQFIRKRIKLQYEAIDCTVITDEKWLLFILEQLLSNALKYTKNGQITISVSEDKILRISDTGIGIAPEDLPRIFEKGFTGYNGRADKKSTGLGLYLSKKAADKLSHTLTVHSVVGKGTTFVLDLQSSSLEVE
jgi:signal transduction histidine kinase